jgi:CubicO group peptidase (beta-lactamase class C family)
MKALTSEPSARELAGTLARDIPALMKKHNVPGLSLALIRDADLYWSHALGVQSVVTQEPVTHDTVFEAASLSKPVYAYAALKLCESGALDLDASLANYLPDPYLPDEPRLDRITMRHVLSHTTGLPNWRPKGKPLKMYLSPGERFSYSGEGFMYLQAVVARVTGQEPAEYVSSHLLKPLAMVNSRFVWNGQEGLPVAVGHDEKGQATGKNLWPEMNAAASLHCTPTDFCTFTCAVMRPSPGDPIHLGPEMTREMLTSQVQVNDCAPWHDDWPRTEVRPDDRVSWGLGWGIQHTSDGDSFWHWGDNGNYRAFALGYPATGHGLVVMTNGKQGQQVINTILRDLVGGDYPGLEWLLRLG